MKSLRVARLQAEELEPREVPATITVTTNADGAPNAGDNVVTLREALLAISEAWAKGKNLGDAVTTNGVVANKGENTINFAIPGNGVHRITLSKVQGNLPVLVGPIVIDGYSQQGKNEAAAKVNSSETGFNGEIRIEIDGSDLNNGTGFRNSRIEGTYSDSDLRGVIKGLAVFGFSNAAFDVGGVGFRNPSGVGYGLQIAGNLIGLAADGSKVTTKNGYGIVSKIQSEVVIGGYTLADRNVISNSSNDGIRIENQFNLLSESTEEKKSKDNREISIVNNLIGTAISGTREMANSQNGIYVENSVSVNIGGSTTPGTPPNWNPITIEEVFDQTKARGNVISGNLIGSGVKIVGGANKAGTGIQITGNLIGTDASGSLRIPNGNGGVYLENTELVHVGGSQSKQNIISGNNGPGVLIHRVAGGAFDFGTNYQNDVSWNYIGTDRQGLKSVHNGAGGVAISGPSGKDSVENNLISGNVGAGIALIAGGMKTPFRTVIRDNIVGLSANLRSSLGNTGNGISLSGAKYSRLEDNVVGGNGQYGVVLKSGSDEVVFRSNLIGVGIDTLGKWVPIPIPNLSGGVFIEDSKKMMMDKDPNASTGNVIAYNNGDGITLIGPDATENTFSDVLVANNAGNGVVIDAGASHNDFSTAAGGGNVISENNGIGVAVLDGTNNNFLGTSFVNNGGMAIDLGGDGPTTNDSLDVDTGANRLQNFPVISAVVVNPNDPDAILVSGSLAATADADFRIGLYANADGVSGAQTYLGYVDVHTDSNGDASFNVSISVESLGDSTAAITAIAVALGGGVTGDTSELSSPVATPPDLTDNVLPVGVNDSYEVEHDETLTVIAAGVLANDTDADGDAITAVLVSGPDHGTLVLNANGGFTYTPDEGFSGFDLFSYWPADSNGNGSLAYAVIQVTNTSPTAEDDVSLPSLWSHLVGVCCRIVVRVGVGEDSVISGILWF